jgi:quinol monooxygenase YgiN
LLNITLSNGKTNSLSDLQLANAEALAQSEGSHLYEIRSENSIEVWDDQAGIYRKIIIIDCQGSGSVNC